MPKRLHVILKDAEYRKIRRAARARRMSVDEWVRQVLIHAHRREALPEVSRKLAALRSAARFEYASADIGCMLAEIEAGYGTDARR